MREFFKKMKLIDFLTTEVEIQKDEFVSIFKTKVEEGRIGLLSEVFDGFTSSKYKFKGHVGFDEFKIKRRVLGRRFDATVVSGNYRQKNEKLLIEAEINGLDMVKNSYFSSFIFYIIFVGWSITVGGDTDKFMLLVFLILGIFTFFVPYFTMRGNVKKMKKELEQEFYNMTKK